MHTLNLGFGQTLLGSALRVMLEANVWGDDSDEKQLKAAFDEFDSWAKANRIPQLDFS